MKKNIITLTFITSLFALASCSDFLDTVPDNRIDIDGADKFAPLLVSAYPTKLPMLMC